MDQPGPRHQARHLPLIIERPDLTHPLRRGLAVVITTLAWLLWLALWIPFLFALARHFGYDLPAIVLPSPISLDAFFPLIRVMPYAIGLALTIFVISYLREKLKARRGTSETRWRPLGMARLATGAALDPERLAAWQAAKVLYVEHGPRGRVTNASTARSGLPSAEASREKADAAR